MCSVLPQFDNYSQQDAQELMLFLLNALNDELKKVRQHETRRASASRWHRVSGPVCVCVCVCPQGRQAPGALLGAADETRPRPELWGRGDGVHHHGVTFVRGPAGLHDPVHALRAPDAQHAELHRAVTADPQRHHQVLHPGTPTPLRTSALCARHLSGGDLLPCASSLGCAGLPVAVLRADRPDRGRAGAVFGVRPEERNSGPHFSGQTAGNPHAAPETVGRHRSSLLKGNTS